MKRRLRLVIVGIVEVAALALAVPLLLLVSYDRTSTFNLSRSAQLDWFEGLAVTATAADSWSSVQLAADRYAQVYDEGLLVIDAAGVVRASAAMRIDDPSVAAAVAEVRRQVFADTVASLRPWSSDTSVLARPIGSVTNLAGVIVMRASTASAKADVTRGWALVIATVAVVGFVAAAASARVGGWVLQPLDELNTAVRDLAEHPRLVTAAARGPVNDAQRHGPPEVRLLARSFGELTDSLEASHQSQQELIASTAHQLRNPLTALQVHLEAMAIAADLRRDDLDRASAYARRLSGSLDSLLAIAEAEHEIQEYSDRWHRRVTGTVEDVPQTTAAEVISEVVTMFKPVAQEAGLSLVALPSAATALLPLPGNRFVEVLENLVENAIKYAGAGSTVEIAEIGRADGTVEIVVSDDGVGIPEADLGRATQRFWRGRPEITGAGLGLAFAEQVVQGYGGSFALAAGDPRGLRVRMTFPPSAAPAAMEGSRR
jgi:signal transduction histidine kinase